MKALLIRNPEAMVQRWKRGRLQPLKGEPRELWQVATDDFGVYGAAARWLAVCAYPNEARKADRFVESVLAWHFWRGGVVAPAAYQWRRRDIDNTLNAAHRRIVNRRLPAAEVANMWQLGQINQGGLRITTHINNITDAIRLAPEYGTSHRDYRNVRRLVWDESLPVLPLMLALRPRLMEMAMQAAEAANVSPEEFEGLDIRYLLRNPEWVRKALLHSWLDARALSQDLGIDASTFIMLTEKA